MTENAFYPIFLCVALVLVRMLERADGYATSSACSRSACVAYETRQQALALFPAVLTAPLLLGPAGPRRFRVLYGAVGGVVLLAAARARRRAVERRSRSSARTRTTGNHGYSVAEVLKWLLWHVAELDLYLGVVPVAAFVVLALSWRTPEPRERAFIAAAASLSAWLIVEVAAFASIPA